MRGPIRDPSLGGEGNLRESLIRTRRVGVGGGGRVMPNETTTTTTTTTKARPCVFRSRIISTSVTTTQVSSPIPHVRSLLGFYVYSRSHQLLSRAFGPRGLDRVAVSDCESSFPPIMSLANLAFESGNSVIPTR